MGVISRSIPTLLRGISQSSDALKQADHADIQDNADSNPVLGLTKRSGSQFVTSLGSSTLGNVHIQTINRDTTEQYVAIFSNGNVKVYELDGTEKTVNKPDGTTYLNTSSPRSVIKTVTIADFTFVVNTSIVSAMDSTLSAGTDTKAIVFINQATANTTYTVTVDGVTYKAGTPPTDQTPKVREQILERFESNLKRLSDQKDNGTDPVIISEEEKESAFIDARDTVLRLYGKEPARKSASMPKLEPSDEERLDRMMRLEAIRITGEGGYVTENDQEDGLITGGDTLLQGEEGRVEEAMVKVEQHFRDKGINVLIDPDQIKLAKVGDVVIRPLRTGGYEAVQVTGFTTKGGEQGITSKRITDFLGFDGEYRSGAGRQPAKKPVKPATPTKKPPSLMFQQKDLPTGPTDRRDG